MRGIALVAMFLCGIFVSLGYCGEHSLGVQYGQGDISTVFLDENDQNMNRMQNIWYANYLRHRRGIWAYGIEGGRTSFQLAGIGADGQYQHIAVTGGIYSTPSEPLGGHMMFSRGLSEFTMHTASDLINTREKKTGSYAKIMLGLDVYLNKIIRSSPPISLSFEFGSVDMDIDLGTRPEKTTIEFHVTQFLLGMRYWFGREYSPYSEK